MNGPTHYAEAERLTAWATTTKHDDYRQATTALATAQVHATLALAAATLAAAGPADSRLVLSWHQTINATVPA